MTKFSIQLSVKQFEEYAQKCPWRVTHEGIFTHHICVVQGRACTRNACAPYHWAKVSNIVPFSITEDSE